MKLLSGGEIPYLYIYIKMLSLFPQNSSPEGLQFTSNHFTDRNSQHMELLKVLSE